MKKHELVEWMMFDADGIPCERLGSVRAYTKSEARAILKRRAGLNRNERLAIGVIIKRV